MSHATGIIIDTIRNPDNARYVYEEVPVPREDAERWHREGIRDARERLARAGEELLEAIAAPLQTTRGKQIRLLPGDPGYDEAPIPFNAAAYQGESVWMNLIRETLVKDALEKMNQLP